MQNLHAIFKSLFKGREDVFAIRREKDGKTSYFPAYDMDWQEYSKHKAQGGSLDNFPNKKTIPLTDEKLVRHLSGKEIIGIYPLLQDNTSWFIAADFDQSESGKNSWIEECKTFMAHCEKYQLPVYLERSRSGQGGHIWLFFNAPYPAVKSRKLFLTLLTDSGIISLFDKSSNFDRLFPNQDSHSGKGFGNLIALPMQKTALEKGNTCFIDPTSLKQFPDQLAFLRAVQKVSPEELDELLDKISSSHSPIWPPPTPLSPPDGKIHITLTNQITIPRQELTPQLVSYLRENLNFLNVDYLIKQKSGRSTYNTEPYFRTLNEKDGFVFLPRGFAGKLIKHCKEQNISYQFEDKRVKLEPVQFKSTISLHEYQLKAVEATNTKDFGVIVAPPGTGKTIMGLYMIAERQQPTLIIVHRKQLFDQWIERIQSFLGIQKFRIGKIEGGKCEIGSEITVAMIQSLQSDSLPEKIYHSFGTILVDECHHIPAKTFREVIINFHSYYLYGFTATPNRKNKDEELIFIHIGKIIHQIVFSPTEEKHNKQLSVAIQETGLFTPFNAKTDNLETLLHILIHDTARNELIVKDIKKEVTAGRKVLVLTERKAHVAILQQYLKSSIETIAITGDDPAQARKSKLDQIHAGHFQALITTGQFMGEGADIDALDCLILAYPFAFEGKLIQYIGRVQRSAVKPTIYDYKDTRIEYLDNLFKQRNRHYRKLAQSGQIKPFEEIILLLDGRRFHMQSTENSFPIDCLDLPMPIEQFLPDICWKIRVISYNHNMGELTGEILDYHYDNSNTVVNLNTSFYFPGIEKIKFRSVDTAGFLKSVILKKQIVTQQAIPEKVMVREKQAVENVVLKTMKVPFSRINFLYGSISFPLFIEEINQELIFEIENADIRPEFDAIREYFSKTLKKKLITTDIAVRFSDSAVISATAKSDDINCINNSLIESVRFEFVKKELFRPKDGSLINKTNTFDTLLGQYHSSAKDLFGTEQDLLNDILNVKKCKHYLHLKYLSSKHETSILKLRFVLQPFSFLFLLSGENKYHIIWETLDSEEATYIWDTERSREALRITLNQIEEIITGIKKSGRQDYLKQEHPNFSRIWHDYSDPKKGFITWKGILEERLV
jgi:superfamily II DNA or RNA helicase